MGVPIGHCAESACHTHALTWTFKQRSKALPLRLSRCKTHPNTIGRPRCAGREQPEREIEMESGGECDHSQNTDQARAASGATGAKQADGATLTPQEDGTAMVRADDDRTAPSDERPRAPINGPAGPGVPAAERDRPVASRTLSGSGTGGTKSKAALLRLAVALGSDMLECDGVGFVEGNVRICVDGERVELSPTAFSNRLQLE